MSEPFTTNIGPCACCGGGGGGGDPIVTGCCSSIPQSLTVTLDGNAYCSPLTGITIPLTYDPTFVFGGVTIGRWIGSKLIDCINIAATPVEGSAHGATVTFQMYCTYPFNGNTSLTLSLNWELGSGSVFGASESFSKTTTSCSPFLQVWDVTGTASASAPTWFCCIKNSSSTSYHITLTISP